MSNNSNNQVEVTNKKNSHSQTSEFEEEGEYRLDGYWKKSSPLL